MGYSGSAAMAKIRELATVMHKRGTGHFRCECGARLVFSRGTGRFEALLDIRILGGIKTGRCPQCARIHSLPISGARHNTAGGR